MFQSDLPIKSSKDDLLSRSAFSYALADAILAYTNQESIVTALYGEWGSGKSSVLNMVLERIEEKSTNKEADNNPIVVKFNPWNYSDQNQLIRQFFRSLLAALNRVDVGSDVKKIGEQLEVYADFFVPLMLIPDPTGLGNILANAANAVFKKMGGALVAWGKNKTKDLEKVRKDLDELLKKQKRKIVIVIDDIDRLNNSEVRQIFQLVKALGDFPNTVYLLAFDRTVVAKALAHVQEGSGDDYLEKIVQIPFRLPQHSLNDIENVLFKELDILISKSSPHRFNKEHWQNIYVSGLKYFFKSLRDVARFVNTLHFSFNIVKNEVDIVDFVTITALQVFEPNIYLKIENNINLLTEYRWINDNEEKQRQKEYISEIIEGTTSISKEQMLEILQRLFPRLRSIYGNTFYSDNSLNEWRRNCRICSPDKVNIFFRLSIPAEDISESKIEEILKSAFNQPLFAARLNLLQLEDSAKIIRFLERMQDYTAETIPLEHIPAIFNTLMDLGDHFPDGNGGIITMRLMHQLSKRYPSHDERFELYRTTIEQATRSIHTIVQEVSVQGQQHGKNSNYAEPEENCTVNKLQLIQLENLAVNKITEWATDGRLQEHKKIIYILHAWKYWTINNLDKFNAFLQRIIESDSGLITFLSRFYLPIYSRNLDSYYTNTEYKINIENIKEFISIESIEPRLRVIATSPEFVNLSPDHQKVVNLFLDTVDGKIKERY